MYDICQKFNVQEYKITPRRLLYHNDRDLADCCNTYCFCKEELSTILISRKKENEAIECIKCILDYIEIHQQSIIHDPKLNQEECDFLKGFSPTLFIQKIDRIVLESNSLCIIQ